MKYVFKRAAATVLLLLLTAGLLLGASFLYAKRTAEECVTASGIPIFAPLPPQFVLFYNEEVHPQWMFRYEINDIYASWPLHIAVSLSGQFLDANSSKADKACRSMGK